MPSKKAGIAITDLAQIGLQDHCLFHQTKPDLECGGIPLRDAIYAAMRLRPKAWDDRRGGTVALHKEAFVSAAYVDVTVPGAGSAILIHNPGAWPRWAGWREDLPASVYRGATAGGVILGLYTRQSVEPYPKEAEFVSDEMRPISDVVTSTLHTLHASLAFSGALPWTVEVMASTVLHALDGVSQNQRCWPVVPGHLAPVRAVLVDLAEGRRTAETLRTAAEILRIWQKPLDALGRLEFLPRLAA